MRHQMPNGNRLPPLPPKLLQILRNRPVQTHLTTLNQQHHRRRRRHHFGQGSRIKNRVLGHPLDLRQNRTIAHHLHITLIPPLQPKHPARTATPLNAPRHRTLNRCQPILVKGLPGNRSAHPYPQ
ncbi:MAG: hypothetical protein RI897_4194 [Verrucomicrobiota bacterium]